MAPDKIKQVASPLLDAVGAVARDVAAADGRLLVAFSGGLDSTVLLHAVARVDCRCVVEAWHVDHGWRPASAQWAQHCVEVAASLGIHCSVDRVEASPQPGVSPEEAARLARYAAFSQRLEPADTLVTAHHGDDQLETLLLRLLRGTGVAMGLPWLSAMRWNDSTKVW